MRLSRLSPDRRLAVVVCGLAGALFAACATTTVNVSGASRHKTVNDPSRLTFNKDA